MDALLQTLGRRALLLLVPARLQVLHRPPPDLLQGPLVLRNRTHRTRSTAPTSTSSGQLSPDRYLYVNHYYHYHYCAPYHDGTRR